MSDAQEIQTDDAFAISGAIPSLGRSYRKLDMLRDFQAAFGSEQGKRVLGHLFSWCDMGAPGLAGVGQGLTASEASLIHVGKRSVGLALMHWLGQIGAREPDESYEQEVMYGGRPRNRGGDGRRSAGHDPGDPGEATGRGF